MLGKEGLLAGPDYRGVPVVAIGKRITDSPWYMVAKEDQEEIYAPLRPRAWFGGSFLVVLAIGVFMAISLMWRRRESELLVRQVGIERERGALAERVALLMKSANDIILIADEN